MVRSTSSRQLWLNAVDNAVVARQLDELADRLAQQGANPFRIAAYRNAAATVRSLQEPVQAIVQSQGADGLLRLPGVGPSIGRTIARFVDTGRMPLLERLRGDDSPQRIFTTVADIGPKLAERIHQQLGIATLAELETAAWNGQLAQVPGMGRKRVQAVREALAGRSTQTRLPTPRPMPESLADQPPVAELLDIDQEYRRLAELDRLPRIAPKRFNPAGMAWLPILRTQRGECNYTALFSNTARAHELGAIRDWVVIFRDEQKRHGQWTVVTSRFGRLRGKRTVSGRERECAEHYAATPLA